jgi:hypothetical protein
MTNEQFCKIYTSYYGELISNINQLVQDCMNGEELKELIEFFIEQLKEKEQ